MQGGAVHLRQCAVLDRKLRAESQARSIFDPEIRRLRTELRGECEAALLADYRLSLVRALSLPGCCCACCPPLCGEWGRPVTRKVKRPGAVDWLLRAAAGSAAAAAPRAERFIAPRALPRPMQSEARRGAAAVEGGLLSAHRGLQVLFIFSSSGAGPRRVLRLQLEHAGRLCHLHPSHMHPCALLWSASAGGASRRRRATCGTRCGCCGVNGNERRRTAAARRPASACVSPAACTEQPFTSLPANPAGRHAKPPLASHPQIRPR